MSVSPSFKYFFYELGTYERICLGWCPNCCEPVTLNFAEEHMMEKHSDMIISRPKPGASSSMVSVYGDADSHDSHHLDQERSVIKVFNEGFELLINYCFQIHRKVDQGLCETRENKFCSKLDEN